MNIKNKLYKFIKHEIPDPPYEYKMLVNINEKEYPLYLKKIFKLMTGENLDLKNPKTFNQKIQWLKLYDATSQKSRLTDKILVRSYIKEKIGETYLKSVIWTGKSFDEIPFEKFPNTFILKTNHGCKWHYKIKDKKRFLENSQLVYFVKNKFDNWMQEKFFLYAGFEMQYRDISPLIFAEEVLENNNNSPLVEYEIYCFNGSPKIYQRIIYSNPVICSVYEENYKNSDIIFNPSYIKEDTKADEILKKITELSSKLAEGFKLVRVDWIECNSRIYFNEMTFTPFSGFYNFSDKNQNIRLGNMLELDLR